MHAPVATEEQVRRHPRLMILSLVALVCAMVALCGCSGSNSYRPELKEAQIAAPVIGEEGTLRVGVNTENPPLAGMGSGKIIGIDVDIAAALADELGLKVVVVDVGSDAASAIEQNKVDVVMGIDDSNTDTSFWLSPSYMPTGIALFALNADVGVPTADSGASFAAQVSSKSAWAVSNEFGEGALTPTDSLSDAFAALSAGSVQYVAADAIIGMYAAHGQDLDVTIVAMLMKPSGYCMGVSSQNADLQAAAGDALARLVENGTIDVIERKWLGTEIALDGLTVISDASTTIAEGGDTSSSEGEGDSGESSDADQSSSDQADEDSSDQSTEDEGSQGDEDAPPDEEGE